MLLFIMAQCFVLTILTDTAPLPVDPDKPLAWFPSLAAKTGGVFILVCFKDPKVGLWGG